MMFDVRYSTFHFLDITHQHLAASRGLTPVAPNSQSPTPLLMYSSLRGVVADSSGSSIGSESPSPGGGAAITPSAAPGKSFTIDAILGLRDESGKVESVETPTDLSASGGGRRPLCLTSQSEQQQNLLQHQVYACRRPIRPIEKTPEAIPTSANKKPAKSKRVRTIFTPEQLERLEAEFERQQYMVGPERLYLAHQLQLTEAQVKVWFQNRRIKWRKQHLEHQQQKLAALKHQQQLQQQQLQGDYIDSDQSSNSGDESSNLNCTYPTAATLARRALTNNGEDPNVPCTFPSVTLGV